MLLVGIPVLVFSSTYRRCLKPKLVICSNQPGGGIEHTQSTRHNGDDPIRDPKRLVEGFRIPNHVLKHLPGPVWCETVQYAIKIEGNSLLRVGDAELLDLGGVSRASEGKQIAKQTLVNSWTRKMPQTSFPCYEKS